MIITVLVADKQLIGVNKRKILRSREVENMRDLSNVMLIEFVKDYGHCKEKCVAIFNINKISEDEVVNHINKCILNYYHPDIMIVAPEQWNSVFGD